MTSPLGRSHTFDARADGYARGEACCTMTLRGQRDPKSRALADVNGSAVRQDGRSASLTAPNGQAQQSLLDAAMSDTSMNTDTLALNEAHGTGTSLGDPIEASSLAASVLKTRRVPLAVGGVKANLGHAEAAAGTTGLLKLLLGLRAGEAAPNAHLRALNPHVGGTLRRLACALPVQLAALEGERGGGVSSFGYSGTITHVVLHHTKGGVRVGTLLVYRRRAFLWQPLQPAKVGSDDNVRSRAVDDASTARVEVTLETVLEMVKCTAGGFVDADAPLMEAGLDSLGSTELHKLLQYAVAQVATLPSTLMFDHPTGREIACFCQELASPEAAEEHFPASGPTMASHPLGCVDICLRGLQVMAPMSVHSTEKLCCVSASGADVCAMTPLSRWDGREVADSLSSNVIVRGADGLLQRAAYGAFLQSAELFDNSRFAIASSQAASMDPQHRAVMECSYASLIGAGLPRAHLKDSATGVYVAIQAAEFMDLVLSTRPDLVGVYTLTGSPHSICCGRISYVLGLFGPCAAYDTACSSGLVAYHAAASALGQEESDAALVAGVNLNLTPVIAVLAAVSGFTSPRGHCHTFDARADGYCRAETCVAVSLQPAAVADGDGVAPEVSLMAAAEAVRADGASASLTAPNGKAQQELLEFALHLSGAHSGPTTLEAHGTGTALGDPIETGAFVAVLLRACSADALYVGSMKANSGHAEPSAGMLGLLTLGLQLARRQAAPNALLRVMNPFLATALEAAGGTRRRGGRRRGRTNGRDNGFGQHDAVVGEASGDATAGGTAAVAFGAQAASVDPEAPSCLGGVSSFGVGGTIAHALLRAASRAGSDLGSSTRPRYRRRAFLWLKPRTAQGGISISLPRSPRAELEAACDVAATDADAPHTAAPLLRFEDILSVVEHASGIAVGADEGMMDAGVDSMGAVEIVNELQKSIGDQLQLPSTLLFDYSSPRKLARRFESLGTPKRRRAPRAAMPADALGACAATGIATHLAGNIDTPGLAWRMLLNGGDLASKIQLEKWDLSTLPAPLSKEVGAAREWCTYLRGTELFDNTCFSITPGEARIIDPMHKLVLERAYESLVVSGRSRGELTASDTGVYVGITAFDYYAILMEIWQTSVFSAVATGACIASGRISFALGLQGPCMSIDTACSASLAAAGAAVNALQLRRNGSSLVAGVNMLHTATAVEMLASAGMLSPRGRCHTFDARADGYLRAEVCVAATLQLADGSGAFEASVASCAVANDGKSASLTAPNGLAQQDVVLQAMSTGGVMPSDYSLCECHGTGTSLGDPIEVGSLKEVILSERVDALALPLGSIKTNLGHSEPSAGLGGLIKLALALGRANAPPNPQLRALNSFLAAAIDGSALCTQPGVLPAASASAGGGRDAGRLVGGVSSFGFSGTIAHAVVDCHTGRCDAPRGRSPALRRRPFGVRPDGRSPRKPAKLTAKPAAPSSGASEPPRLEVEQIRAVVKETAGLTPDLDLPLMDAGLDSLGMVDLSRELGEACGDAKMPQTLMYDYPSIRALTRYFARPSTSSKRPLDLGGRANSGGSGRCAISGISSLLPGGMRQARDFVQCLLGGASTAMHVPAERWDSSELPAAATSRAEKARSWGSFVRGLPLFDHRFFRITKPEAAIMDPMQRIALERGYEALAAAGLSKADLDGSMTGSYVGATAIDFLSIVDQQKSQSAFVATAVGHSIISGRISYALGLVGPCMTIDSACSATLSAMHCAVPTLQSGFTEQDLVIGPNVLHSFSAHNIMATAGMITAVGRCATWDADADGYLRAEACCGCVLQLDEANSSALKLLGVAIAQDGTSASLTAPNGAAQQAVMLHAYGGAAMHPEGVSIVEAHGTGTPVGDPIEASSIAEAIIGNREPSARPPAVGSAKANVGHAEPVAGMIGFIKLALQLQVARAPPNAQLRALNPLLMGGVFATACLAAHQCPFSPPSDAPPASQLAGGVNSFGYSGTIGHAVASRSAPSDRLACAPFHRYKRTRFRYLSHQPMASKSDGPSTQHAASGGGAASEVIMRTISESLGVEIGLDATFADEGLDSMGATDMRNALFAIFPDTTLPASLVFDFPTPRSLIAQLTGGNALMVIAPKAPPSDRSASPSAPKETCVGPWLYRERRGTTPWNPPMFLVPSTDGNGLLYSKGPALSGLTNALYSVVFEYHRTADEQDCQFPSLESLAVTLAAVLLQECAALGTGKFDMMGANLAAPLMKFIANTARKSGARPCHLVLIDPFPAPPFVTSPIHFPEEHECTPRYVAAALLVHNRVPNHRKIAEEDLANCADEEVGMVCAHGLSMLGFKPFNKETVRQTQRELHCEVMFLKLINRHVRRRMAGDPAAEALIRDEAASDSFINGVFCGCAGDGRAEFFEEAFGIGLDGTGGFLDMSWYGQLVELPRRYDGHHIDVCLRLFTGREPAFKTRLEEFIEGDLRLGPVDIALEGGKAAAPGISCAQENGVLAGGAKAPHENGHGGATPHENGNGGAMPHENGNGAAAAEDGFNPLLWYRALTELSSKEGRAKVACADFETKARGDMRTAALQGQRPTSAGADEQALMAEAAAYESGLLARNLDAVRDATVRDAEAAREQWEAMSEERRAADRAAGELGEAGRREHE